MGFEKDETKAFEYYEKSAKKGHNMAQYILGSLYESGKDIEKDLEKALYWYKKATEDRNKEAQSILSNFYALGIDVKINDETNHTEIRTTNEIKEAVKFNQKEVNKTKKNVT